MKPKESLPSETFRQRVVRLGADRNMSQTDIARAIGVEPSLFSRMLDQRRPTRRHHVSDLARVLGVDASELGAPLPASYLDPVEEAAAIERTRKLAAGANVARARKAEVAGLRAEVDSLRTALDAQSMRTAEAQARADRLAAELSALRARYEAEAAEWGAVAP